MRLEHVYSTTCVLILLGTFLTVWCAGLDRYSRNVVGNTIHDIGPLSPSDEEKLDNIYGSDVIKDHRSNFVQAEEMEKRQNLPRYHYRDRQSIMETGDGQRQLYESHPVQNQPLTQAIVKKLLKDMLERLETLGISEGSTNEDRRSHVTRHRCSLHGLWISAVTGVAFQLQPFHEGGLHNVFRVQIFDTGTGSPETQFITNQWMGTAQVSTDSQTTISIILQERVVDLEKEQKTAVFVGQCVLCNESPTIQGTWVLFPKNQVCFQEARPPQADVMYLLTR